MTTKAPPAQDVDAGGLVEFQSRRLLITVVAISVLLVAVASWVLIDRGGESESTVQAEIEVLFDDYFRAWEQHDEEAFRALVTLDFVINEYYYEVAGDRVFMTEHIDEGLENAADVGLSSARQWRPEQIGEPIIFGDGPWFVSIGENWILESDRGRETDFRGDGVSTYVVVDEDGILRIANHFWAGRSYLANE